MQPIQSLWEFLITDKTWGQPILASLIAGIAILFLQLLTGLPLKLIGLPVKLLSWWRLSRLRIEIKAFDVITDPATLLPKLYGEENNPDVLAHHRIPYQRRDPSCDTQGELRAALNKKRHLLISARTGIGKTREAATLAASLMNEGWRVVRIKTGWLDIPREYPSELGNDRRRILILLDDLNGLFRTGGFMQSPKAEQKPILGQPSYHDRLFGLLDAFDKMCGENEVRVIATARDEIDEWKTLNFDQRDPLWKKFERVKLTDPREDAVIEFLTENVVRANISALRADFPAIARENDGTFANVILNLRRSQKENRRVTLTNYTATLDGSWREVYIRTLRIHPATRYVFESIDLLRQTRIELYEWLIVPTVLIIWGGNWLQRLFRLRKTIRALEYLTEEQKIISKTNGRLVPRDGQIEVYGEKIDKSKYVFSLYRLLLFATDARLANMIMLGIPAVDAGYQLFLLIRYLEKKLIVSSLAGFGFTLYELKLLEQAVKLSIRGTEIAPENANMWWILGLAQSGQKLHSKAEEAYRRAIALDTSNAHIIYLDLANSLEDMDRENEAVECLYRAIDHKPDYADAYYNLALLFDRILDRRTEAEENYRLALKYDPYNIGANVNLGMLLAFSGKYEEAESQYKHAIEVNPNSRTAFLWYGILLEKLGRHREAIEAYLAFYRTEPSELDWLFYYQLIEIYNRINCEQDAVRFLDEHATQVPEYWEAYLAMASLYKQVGALEKSMEYAIRARKLIPDSDWYNLTRLDSICGNIDIALEDLRRAAQKEAFNRVWAWRDRELEWIRGDPRFREIVGPPPNENETQ